MKVRILHNHRDIHKTIDNIFTNKIVKKKPFDTKRQIWFSNLSLSDYTFLEDLYKSSNDEFDYFGTHTQTPTTAYKKNLLFVNDFHTEKPSLFLFVGCMVTILEKDRGLISYDISHEINLKNGNKHLENVINSTLRKTIISNLLDNN